jgi:predicted flavoprotein YhiN
LLVDVCCVTEKKAIKELFGEHVFVALCTWHKARNIVKVLSKLLKKEGVDVIHSSFWRCVFANSSPDGIATILGNIEQMIVTCGGEEALIQAVIASLESRYIGVFP